MVSKVLIANRGEIALRVIRACQEMGLGTVAVYSSVDRNALHVRRADEAYELGPPPASESYLRVDKLLEVARASGADAVHPGYGFLAENAGFAEACRGAGLTFVGPPPEAMRAMGDKVEARRRMIEAGVPVVPGTGAFTGGPEEARAAAAGIGFPIMVKAAAGGGGKGMRVVRSEGELVGAIERARSEAGSSFGDDTVYMERLVERPRHIEVQVLFDRHGRGVHLGERECSIQRRHQKLLEECPSPIIDAATRARLGELALAAGRAANYESAGTVEFLRGDDGSFYFMEMNARLQVEHPITEEVYGVDLVRAQLLVASGEPLPFEQDALVPRGHAIECRITAEDPAHNFMPSPGRVEALRTPSGPGIREDAALAPGYEVPIHYDPMVAKIIASGADREQAIARMRRALDEYRLVGLTTNIPFLRRLVDHPDFVAGRLHTGFLEDEGKGLLVPAEPEEERLAVLAAAIAAHREARRAAASPAAAGQGGADSSWLRLGRGRRMGVMR